MYIGIDPGINCLAVAILNDDGSVKSGHIIESDRELSQLDRMLLNVGSFIDSFDGEASKVAIEFTLARIGPSITSISQLGVCSGALWGFFRTRGDEACLVQPSQWQKKKGKEENAEHFIAGLSADFRRELHLNLGRYKKPLQHNLIDAFAIACLRYENDDNR